MKKTLMVVCVVCMTVVSFATLSFAIENQVDTFLNLCKNGTVEEFDQNIREVGVDIFLNDRRDTPLLVAAKNNMFGIVRRLCDMGADISVVNTNGTNALMYAAVNRNPKMIKYLLDMGMSVDSRANDTHDPILHLMFTIDNRRSGFHYHKEITELSLKELLKAGQENYETYRILIENGARVDDVNDEGNTFIHVIVPRPANVYFLKMLYDLDPEGTTRAITMRNKYGLSPLDIARNAKNVSSEVRDFLNKTIGHTTKLDPYN